MCFICLGPLVVFQRSITLMQRAGAPGLSISTPPRSGTYSQPMRRAASAGKDAWRSGVVVKKAPARSSACALLASIIAATSSAVAAWISSRVSPVATVAPRTPRHMMRLLSFPSFIGLLAMQTKRALAAATLFLSFRRFFCLPAGGSSFGYVAVGGGYRIIPPVIIVAVLSSRAHVDRATWRGLRDIGLLL